MVYPDLETLTKLAENHERATVYREVHADTVTPITLLTRFQDKERMFLLESARLDKSFSRFSFFGTDPVRTFRLYTNRLVIESVDGQTVIRDNPFGYLVEQFRGQAAHPSPEFGAFNGGFVGWFAYEAVNLMDILRTPLPVSTDEPLAVFFEVDQFFILDNHRFKLYAACSIPLDGDVAAAYRATSSRTAAMAAELNSATPAPSAPVRPAEFEREMERDAFMDKVNRIRDEIEAGECIQAVLSNRYRLPGKRNPITFYRALRRVNPSPYLFLVKDGDTVLTGSSPETHLKVKDGIATLKPIAGTIAHNPSDDLEQLKRRLLNDPKERAEHLMLVDLARNDLYTRCDPTSIQLTRAFEPEVYSHVIHIVSEVTGQLADGVTALELFARTFPAGTLTGAPKVRAIELIQEMESSPRGFYGGCVGYFSYAGDMDTCITIRSACFTPEAAEIRAGAGIVYDSRPDREFDEVEGKLAALFSAFRLMEELEDSHVPARG